MRYEDLLTLLNAVFKFCSTTKHSFQSKHIKEYEKRVNEAKSKLKKQMKQAAESYISAIRSQQAQMGEDLEGLFKNDMAPVQVE